MVRIAIVSRIDGSPTSLAGVVLSMKQKRMLVMLDPVDNIHCYGDDGIVLEAPTIVYRYAANGAALPVTHLMEFVCFEEHGGMDEEFLALNLLATGNTQSHHMLLIQNEARDVFFVRNDTNNVERGFIVNCFT